MAQTMQQGTHGIAGSLDPVLNYHFLIFLKGGLLA